MRNIKNQNLDERELLIRGNIFKHALLTMGLFVIINATLDYFKMYDSNNSFTWTVPILAALAVLMIELSYHQIYPISKKLFSILYTILGVYGAFVIGLAIFLSLKGQFDLITNNTLTDNALLLFMGIIYIMAFISFLVFSKRITCED